MTGMHDTPMAEVAQSPKRRGEADAVGVHADCL